MGVVKAIFRGKPNRLLFPILLCLHIITRLAHADHAVVVGKVLCRDGNTNKYIDASQVCDGNKDCPSNSDEEPCLTAASGVTCIVGTVLCSNRLTCATPCNKVNDCPGGEDESVCGEGCRCPDGTFICANGPCLPLTKVCDGRADCAGGEDEKDCSCTNSQYRCQGNPVRCVSNAQVCNGVADCMLGDDEVSCGCLPNQYKCRAGQCIPPEQLCDGTPQCPNGDDELNCPCSKGLHKCSGENKCIKPDQICDRNKDCASGEDENNCGCGLGEFNCGQGKCIPITQVCDATPQCQNGIDEQHCDKVCTNGMFRCGAGNCITKTKVCDGKPDCPGGLDEQDCPKGCHCPSQTFICTGDNTCVGVAELCKNPGGPPVPGKDCPVLQGHVDPEDETPPVCKAVN